MKRLRQLEMQHRREPRFDEDDGNPAAIIGLFGCASFGVLVGFLVAGRLSLQGSLLAALLLGFACGCYIWRVDPDAVGSRLEPAFGWLFCALSGAVIGVLFAGYIALGVGALAAFVLGFVCSWFLVFGFGRNAGHRR